MTINVNNLTVSQAQYYYLNYNNGNSKGISEAEYQSICTKFSSYISTWESSDENSYTESPEERLDYDSDDAGLGLQGSAQVTTGAIIAATTIGGTIAATTGAASISAFESMAVPLSTLTGQQSERYAQTVKKSANENSGMLLILAGLQAAEAAWYLANKPNKEAVEACETAQDELYTEQANLADYVADMADMEEEMEQLQEEALDVNETGQSNIAQMEGLYNYYYTKYQNGTATSSDLAIMKALAAQMQTTQSETNETTVGLNGEITSIGDEYEVITANIEITNEFTDYVSEIDSATKTATIVQGSFLTLMAASAAYTCSQCIIRANTLSASVFGSWAAVMYYAAAALSGAATLTFGSEAYTQLTDYREIANDTIDIRKETEELSTATQEYEEISIESWEETVELTNEDNLFTLTPTYAIGSASETSTGTEDDTDTDTKTGTATVVTTTDDDKDKTIYD